MYQAEFIVAENGNMHWELFKTQRSIHVEWSQWERIYAGPGNLKNNQLTIKNAQSRLAPDYRSFRMSMYFSGTRLSSVSFTPYSANGNSFTFEHAAMVYKKYATIHEEKARKKRQAIEKAEEKKRKGSTSCCCKKKAEEEKARLAELARKKVEEEKERLAELARKKEAEEKERLAEIAREIAEKEKKRLAEEEKARQVELARKKAEEEKARLAELARKQAEEEKKRKAELARKQLENKLITERSAGVETLLPKPGMMNSLKAWYTGESKLPQEAVKKAQAGDVSSILKIGNIYRLGSHDIDRDGIKAEKWFSIAEKTVELKNLYTLKEFYREIEQENKVYRITQKIAESDIPNAQFEIGQMLYAGTGTAKNEKEAFLWWVKALENGYKPQNPIKFGRIFVKNIKSEEHFQHAINIFKSAKPLSDGYAEIANAYMAGYGTSANFQKSWEWYLQAQKLGYELDTLRIGKQFLIFAKSEENFNTAVNVLKQTNPKENGYMEIAKSYHEGIGTHIDLQQAYEWYLKAVRHQNI